MKSTSAAILLAALALLPSCDKQPATSAAPTANPAPAELLAVFDEAISSEASPIHLARTTVQPGDKVVLKGRIMGSKTPFVDGRAAFILGDPEVLTPCSDKPDDGCETPWDTCCDTKEDLRRGTATIRIVDAGGRVLKTGLDGVRGLGNLASLTVEGTVAEASTGDNLVVDARAIRVD